MQRDEEDRLELRFVGLGPRGQVEHDDGRVADFDGWTDLGRAIHDLAGLDDASQPESSQRETREENEA